MENIVFTQLSITEIRHLFREELQTYFSEKPLSNSPNSEDELLTVNQAAQLLTLSVPTIYGLVSKSQLPVSKKGKRLYFSKQELFAWIKGGRKRTQHEIGAEAENYIKGKNK